MISQRLLDRADGKGRTAAVEVLINMVVGASGARGLNPALGGVNDTVTDAVLLRLTPPDNQVATGASFGPCQ